MERKRIHHAIDKENGQWVEGYLCKCHHKDTGKYDYAIQEMFENGYIMHEVIPETVSEFTEKCDDYWQKLFEGDECRVTKEAILAYGVIKLIDGAFCFVEHYYKTILPLFSLKTNGFEIKRICSIHDNKQSSK